jgi:hypothetical protein
VKYATLSKSAFVVTALLGALAACANSAEVPPETSEAPIEPAPETKLPASTPNTAPTTPPEKKCAPSCATDSDCTNSCPALAGGVQCCDTKTKTCWGSKTSSCPAPPTDQPDAGDPPPAY